MTSPSRLALIGAFAVIYLVWGSTYLAIRIAVETLPPLLMAGSRFLVAGAILLAIMPTKNIRASDWPRALLIGTLMLGLGNGFVSHAEVFMPSGIAALLVATVPLWLMIYESVLARRRPSAWALAGLVLGMAGIGLLVDAKEGWANQVVQPWAIAGVLLGASAWALGGLLSRKRPSHVPFLTTVGMQMVCGGAVLVAAGLLMGESPVGVQFAWRSVAAWAFLVIFGSLLAFSCYTWLLARVPSAKVGTYAFVNPVVAVALGAALAHEPLNLRMAAAATLVAGAVAMTLYGAGRTK